MKKFRLKLVLVVLIFALLGNLVRVAYFHLISSKKPETSFPTETEEVDLLTSIESSSIWPMFRYNARHTGICPYDTSKNNGTLKWKFQIEKGCGSPVIAKDRTLYVGSMDKYLYAVNPNGTLKWKFKTGSCIEASPAVGPDGTIYIGSDDYYFYAIYPNGRLKWKFKSGEFMIISSAAIASNGTIYFAGLDSFYALNPDGKVIWKIKELGGCGSPSIGKDGTIYQEGSIDIGHDVGEYFFCAVTQDGKIKWKFEIGNYAFGSTIAKEGTIYFASNNGYLYALNPDGTLKWKYKGAGTPTISSDGTLYVGTENGLYAFGSE